MMQGVELTRAVEFARGGRQSVLTTIRNDTRPQLSSVLHEVGEDGLIRISITASRAKYGNMLRRPWAALHVSSSDFWSYVVIEADVELSAPAADVTDGTVDELVGTYRRVAGEHSNWDEFRAAMVAERRVVARLSPIRAYGLVR